VNIILAEVRSLRAELGELRAMLSPAAQVAVPSTLPLRLTVPEFARLVRLCEETIRRMIRARQIEADGPPFLIPRRELEKFGVSPLDAATVA
jgi:hypothetical protein